MSNPFATPSLPGSPVHVIFQKRILEWVAISFSMGSSWTKDEHPSPALAGGSFTAEPLGKPSRICIGPVLFHEEIVKFSHVSIEQWSSSHGYLTRSHLKAISVMVLVIAQTLTKVVAMVLWGRWGAADDLVKLLAAVLVAFSSRQVTGTPAGVVDWSHLLEIFNHRCFLSSNQDPV